MSINTSSIVHLQISRKVNRIMGKKVAAEINEIWGELGPQIIELARQKVDNSKHCVEVRSESL